VSCKPLCSDCLATKRRMQLKILRQASECKGYG
jgi:hypothetical protein